MWANNDRRYALASLSTVTVAAGSGGKANGTVTLTVPASAESGTDVTLTTEVENAAATDINYAVLRFSVAAKVRENDRGGLETIKSLIRVLRQTLLCVVVLNRNILLANQLQWIMVKLDTI